MKEKVREIVEDFESGAVPEEATLARLQELTGREVDSGWLKNYWRSESIDDFADRVCAEPITNWDSLSDSEAEQLIREYVSTQSPGRQDIIEDAITRRYRKSSGTLSDLVFQSDIEDPAEIVRILKKDDVIYL